MHKKLISITLVLVAGTAAVWFGMRWIRTNTAAYQPPVIAENKTGDSPTDRQLRKGEELIKRSPDSPDGYNLLASAYMQKARETGDFGFNAQAEAALQRSLNLRSEEYDTLRLQATLLLTFHRFAEGLEVARKAQALRPANADIYGAITDAQVELGAYPEAIESAQKMMDLRPDTAAYSRVSYLRELHGDPEGAIEAMRIAVKISDPNSPESAAWCRVHLGLQLMNVGKRDEAEHEFDAALSGFPDYYLALSAKAKARAAAGDTTNALELYRQAQARVPLPDVVSAYGDLLAQLGRNDEANRQYELTEFIERSGASASSYSRQLALYLADHGLKLDEALAIARRERAARSDIYTCDVLAWCLYKQGLFAEAKTAMTEALRLGTKDARLYYHAGLIAERLGDRPGAQKYLGLALRTDASFNFLQAATARRTLRELAA
ncbi:MAG: tetratricopeptide repeat protein [Pyrinomonadaceae bacterium]